MHDSLNHIDLLCETNLRSLSIFALWVITFLLPIKVKKWHSFRRDFSHERLKWFSMTLLTSFLLYYLFFLHIFWLVFTYLSYLLLPRFLTFFLSFMTYFQLLNIVFLVAFPPFGNSDVFIIMSIGFPKNYRDVLFYYVVLYYIWVDSDGFCDHIKNILWQDLFNKIIFSLKLNLII